MGRIVNHLVLRGIRVTKNMKLMTAVTVESRNKVNRTSPENACQYNRSYGYTYVYNLPLMTDRTADRIKENTNMQPKISMCLFFQNT